MFDKALERNRKEHHSPTTYMQLSTCPFQSDPRLVGIFQVVYSEVRVYPRASSRCSSCAQGPTWYRWYRRRLPFLERKYFPSLTLVYYSTLKCRSMTQQAPLSQCQGKLYNINLHVWVLKNTAIEVLFCANLKVSSTSNVINHLYVSSPWKGVFVVLIKW